MKIWDSSSKITNFFRISKLFTGKSSEATKEEAPVARDSVSLGGATDNKICGIEEI